MLGRVLFITEGATMRIGLIGAGGMGQALARKLAAHGLPGSMASSRTPEQLTTVAAEIRSTPAAVAEAVVGAKIVVLAIPTKAVADLAPSLFADAAGDVVVIDIANYHPELRDGRIDEIDRGMLESEWVARTIGRPVVKAFNTIYAASLREKGVPRGTKGRIALPVAGDPSGARRIVLRLVDDLGFDPVDAGGLEQSWRQQTGTPAYCKDLELAALTRALAAAERSRVGEYRAEEENRLREEVS